jgi:hypothetical protein
LTSGTGSRHPGGHQIDPTRMRDLIARLSSMAA